MINKLIAIILKEARDRRENAGYSGSYGDGGASALEEQARFYNYGRQGIIPPEWKIYEKNLDPEYIKYQELKKKFE